MLIRDTARHDRHFERISRNTGDAQAPSFFKEQYYECRKNHSKCQTLAPYNDFRPTRAIYVGYTDQETVVRLCDASDFIAGSSYTVLSHCWGKQPQPIMLTKLTVKMLKDGVPQSSLPKTFQDAITVTRMFYIQYIWIDSL